MYWEYMVPGSGFGSGFGFEICYCGFRSVDLECRMVVGVGSFVESSVEGVLDIRDCQNIVGVGIAASSSLVDSLGWVGSFVGIGSVSEIAVGFVSIVVGFVVDFDCCWRG